MNKDLARARAFALWLLQYVGPRENRETIIGDLLEQAPERKSATWFWREVLSALAAGIRVPWKDAGLALLGPVLPILLWRPVLPISLWRLPNPFLDGVSFWAVSWGWPLSAVFDCALRLVELTVLLTIEVIVVLALRRTLRWANAGRAVLISFPILSVGLLLSLELDGHLSHQIENAVAQIPFFCAMLAALVSSGRGRLATAPRGGMCDPRTSLPQSEIP
jgi:hypothetical protein